jgi:hypothetical protein
MNESKKRERRRFYIFEKRIIEKVSMYIDFLLREEKKKKKEDDYF